MAPNIHGPGVQQPPQPRQALGQPRFQIDQIIRNIAQAIFDGLTYLFGEDRMTQVLEFVEWLTTRPPQTPAAAKPKGLAIAPEMLPRKGEVFDIDDSDSQNDLLK